LENISKLKSTCVIAAHGRNDYTIPFSHSLRLKAAYSGSGKFTVIESPNAGHNDIIDASFKEASRVLSECFSGKK